MLCPSGATGCPGPKPPFPAAAAPAKASAHTTQATRVRSFRTAGWHSTKVPEQATRELSRCELPVEVGGSFDVYVNGVPQVRGRDYEVEGRTLVFSRRLAQEGRLGFWRSLSLFLGV